MKKFILLTILGVLMTLTGIICAYLHFDSPLHVHGPWFLIVSVILTPLGLFVLSRVVAMGNKVYNLATEAELEQLNKVAIKPAGSDETFQSNLEKNNALVADYAKTSKTRDQLKVLEIAGAAEEQAGK